MRSRALAVILAVGLAAGGVSAPIAEGAFPGERGLIAFSQDDRIYTVAGDGSSLRRLTDSGVNRSPSWSADGTRLAWSCDDDICISDSDGSNVEHLTGLPEKERRPAWSPDSEWIVFTRPEDPLDDEIGAPAAHIYKVEVADPDNVVRLTDFPSSDPEWSPDGRWIAYFKGNMRYAGELWVMRSDGTDSRLLSDRYGQGATPSWSPDGSRIAFLGKRRNRWRVCIVTAGGKLLREFGFERAMSLGVAWSPDGRRLVYVGTGRLERELFVSRPDGSGTRRIGQVGRSPDWQPRQAPASKATRKGDSPAISTPSPGPAADNRRIAFSAIPHREGSGDPQCQNNGDTEIFTIRPDGRGLRRLTDNRVSDSWPSWSPSRRKIVSSSTVRNTVASHELGTT